ncbi:siderophore-interacting protein [Gryllotalpicola kribbensis]|uniref:siderophore-interacting protein n=1 Tax=Gryllotalpicola kribbensis TaxID=993084 RepID=UPI003CD0A8C8
MFPTAAGALPELDPEAGTWYEAWLALPEDRRGTMRTYSVREVTGSGASTRGG